MTSPSMASSFMPTFPAAQAIDLADRLTWFTPQMYYARGDGTGNDAPAIQNAINDALASKTGTGVVWFPPGLYRVQSQITIPITARNLTLMGYGAYIVGAVNNSIVKVSDLTTANNAAQRISILGLTVQGLGPLDATYPAQNGIEIGAVIQFTLRDVNVVNIPNIGIIGNKSGMSGSTYFEQVNFDHIGVQYCGKQTMYIGSTGSADDLTVINSLFQGGGQNISSNVASASVVISAIVLHMLGCEIAGTYSTTTGGAGYRWGMLINNAAGSIIGNHYEGNGNDQAGSADLLLDTNANGMVVQGSNHYGSLTSAAKFAIQTTSKNNVIIGTSWAGNGATHNYDYIINAGSATNCQIFNVVALGPTFTPNVAVTNGSGTAIQINTADTNAVLGLGALATNATDGFVYVPSCAGIPTGTPTTKSGYAPIVVNSTNNKLYFYSTGAWRDAGP